MNTVPANFDAQDKWPELNEMLDQAHAYARANGIALTTLATDKRELEDLGDQFRESSSTRTQVSNAFHHNTKNLTLTYLENAYDKFTDAFSSPEQFLKLYSGVRQAIESQQTEICEGQLVSDPTVHGQGQVTH